MCMTYDEIKLNVKNNIELTMCRQKLSVDDAISFLIDFYLTNEMFDFLSVILSVQYEIFSLRQNLINNFYNNLFKTI